MSSETQPTISVLIPCYNAEATVDEAVASIAAQTLGALEIVAVDDGSTDGTLARLRSWEAREPRLRLVARPHLGLIAALNAAIGAARAPYLARMDADDWSHPERLARQLALLESDDRLAVVGCGVAGLPPEAVRPGFAVYLGWLNGLTTHEQIARQLFVESPLVHPSVVMRRAWVERAGGYQERGWPEDYDLWMRLLQAGGRAAKVPEVLFGWRDHPARLTRADGRYSLENFLRLKAHYLAHGPLRDHDAVIVWGAGMTGRRLGRQLQRAGAPLAAFLDANPAKHGRTLLGLPISAPDELPDLWARAERPALLVALRAGAAQQPIRAELARLRLREEVDWWQVA